MQTQLLNLEVQRDGRKLLFKEKYLSLPINSQHMQVADTLVLKIDKSKKKAFLEMLKLLDFVEVQTQKSVLQRFVKNAPKNAPLSYDDIVDEVMAHRYGKK